MSQNHNTAESPSENSPSGINNNPAPDFSECPTCGNTFDHSYPVSSGPKPNVYSPNWFIVDTDDVIKLLRDNAVDLANDELSFTEAEWYMKGVLGILRNVEGPARTELFSRLKGMSAAFAKVDVENYQALEELKSEINEHLSQ